MSEGKLSGRVAVVTGASRGIGYAAALALAKEGVHVVAVARTVGGLEELDDEITAAGGSATLVPFDLTDYEAIDRLGGALYERWGRLDMLLGNAGLLGVVTPLPHLKPKVFEEVMAVNVTANFRLIRSLDPLLRQSDAGRALFVSSGAAAWCPPFLGLYSASKAALEALVRTYAGEIRHTAIRANLINPGPLRTHMRAQSIPGEDPATLQPPEALAPDIVRMLSPDYDDNGVRFDFPTGETTRLLATD
ncbi:SDR family NAD(P)-dependent oxidoreductase [Bauldia sp.]|uniref:SDR family NAD(P)-dependent oxidoreductase n=1 Tax=Bauldia sp. TaxID=2575872 RepID=UPI003BAB30C0